MCAISSCLLRCFSPSPCGWSGASPYTWPPHLLLVTINFPCGLSINSWTSLALSNRIKNSFRTQRIFPPYIYRRKPQKNKEEIQQHTDQRTPWHKPLPTVRQVFGPRPVILEHHSRTTYLLLFSFLFSHRRFVVCACAMIPPQPLCGCLTKQTSGRTLSDRTGRHYQSPHNNDVVIAIGGWQRPIRMCRRCSRWASPPSSPSTCCIAPLVFVSTNINTTKNHRKIVTKRGLLSPECLSTDEYEEEDDTY